MLYLLDENGTSYKIDNFSKDRRGFATGLLNISGIFYPTVCEWGNCTLLIGDTRISDVRVGITRISLHSSPDQTLISVNFHWREDGE